MSVSKTSTGRLAADDFNRADSTTPGSFWTEESGGGDIVSNKVRVSAASGGAALLNSTVAARLAQFVQADISWNTATVPAIILVASTPFASRQGYQARIDDIGNALRIDRQGTFTTLASVSGSFSAGNEYKTQFYSAAGVQQAAAETSTGTVTVTAASTTHDAVNKRSLLQRGSGNASQWSQFDNYLMFTSPTLTAVGAAISSGRVVEVRNTSSGVIRGATVGVGATSATLDLSRYAGTTAWVPSTGWAALVLLSSAGGTELDRSTALGVDPGDTWSFSTASTSTGSSSTFPAATPYAGGPYSGVWANGVDLYADCGFVLDRPPGWRDAPFRSHRFVSLPKRRGFLKATADPSWEPRKLRLSGVVQGDTNAVARANLRKLKARLSDGGVRYSFPDASTLEVLGYLDEDGIAVEPIGPPLADNRFRVDASILCPSPRYLERSTYSVGFGSTRTLMPLGTAPTYPVITVSGATTFTLTYKTSTGGTVKTFGLSGATGAPFTIDMEAETVLNTSGDSQIESRTTGSDFFALDPYDGTWTASSWPTLEVSAGSGTCVYRRAYLEG